MSNTGIQTLSIILEGEAFRVTVPKEWSFVLGDSGKVGDNFEIPPELVEELNLEEVKNLFAIAFHNERKGFNYLFFITPGSILSIKEDKIGERLCYGDTDDDIKEFFDKLKNATYQLAFTLIDSTLNLETVHHRFDIRNSKLTASLLGCSMVQNSQATVKSLTFSDIVDSKVNAESLYMFNASLDECKLNLTPSVKHFIFNTPLVLFSRTENNKSFHLQNPWNNEGPIQIC